MSGKNLLLATCTCMTVLLQVPTGMVTDNRSDLLERVGDIYIGRELEG